MDTFNSPEKPQYQWPLPGTLAPNARLTWSQWCAWQAQHIEARTQSVAPLFRERELAHLSFLRWLLQTGHLAA